MGEVRDSNRPHTPSVDPDSFLLSPLKNADGGEFCMSQAFWGDGEGAPRRFAAGEFGGKANLNLPRFENSQGPMPSGPQPTRTSHRTTPEYFLPTHNTQGPMYMPSSSLSLYDMNTASRPMPAEYVVGSGQSMPYSHYQQTSVPSGYGDSGRTHMIETPDASATVVVSSSSGVSSDKPTARQAGIPVRPQYAQPVPAIIPETLQRRTVQAAAKSEQFMSVTHTGPGPVRSQADSQALRPDSAESAVPAWQGHYQQPPPPPPALLPQLPQFDSRGDAQASTTSPHFAAPACTPGNHAQGMSANVSGTLRHADDSRDRSSPDAGTEEWPMSNPHHCPSPQWTQKPLQIGTNAHGVGRQPPASQPVTAAAEKFSGMIKHQHITDPKAAAKLLSQFGEIVQSASWQPAPPPIHRSLSPPPSQSQSLSPPSHSSHPSGWYYSSTASRSGPPPSTDTHRPLLLPPPPPPPPPPMMSASPSSIPPASSLRLLPSTSQPSHYPHAHTQDHYSQYSEYSPHSPAMPQPPQAIQYVPPPAPHTAPPPQFLPASSSPSRRPAVPVFSATCCEAYVCDREIVPAQEVTMPPSRTANRKGGADKDATTRNRARLAAAARHRMGVLFLELAAQCEMDPQTYNTEQLLIRAARKFRHLDHKVEQLTDQLDKISVGGENSSSNSKKPSCTAVKQEPVSASSATSSSSSPVKRRPRVCTPTPAVHSLLHSPLSMSIVSADGLLLDLNHALRSILGLPKPGTGSGSDIQAFLTDESSKAAKTRIRRAMKARKPAVWQTSLTLVTADKQLVSMIGVSAIVKRADGTPLAVFSSLIRVS